MKCKVVIFDVLVLSLLACAQMGIADVLAQTGGPYDLSWSTVDGGGQASSGGTYWVGGTAGQPDAGDVLIGGGLELMGGFWSFQEGNPNAITLHSLGSESMLDSTGLAIGMAIGVIVSLGGPILWRRARQRNGL